MSNEFFPYLKEIEILDIFDNEIKIFFVENIIHFSYWLLKYNYTSSKITVVFPKNNYEVPKIEKNKKKSIQISHNLYENQKQIIKDINLI